MKKIARPVPTPESAAHARAALRVLRAVPRKRFATMHIGGRGDRPAVTVPPEAFDLFLQVLGQIAEGKAVTLVPLHGELTTQQVADVLGVSRPHAAQILDRGLIPSRRVGTHRRARVEDVMAYREREDRRRKAILDELAAEAQRLGLGY